MIDARAGRLARVGYVLAASVSALRTAWLERRWPGPPSTWPASLRFLWRGGVPRPPRAIRPTAMDRAAFEASFARHYRLPANRVESGRAWPALTVVVCADVATPLREIVRGLDEVPGLAWDLWLLAFPGTLADAALAADPRIHVVADPSSTAGMVPGDAPFVLLLEGDTLPLSAGLVPALQALVDGDADWVYTDDACRGADGTWRDAYLKGAFAPEQALADDYATRLALANRRALEQAGGLRPAAAPACLQDLVLRLAAAGGRIRHVDVLGAVRMGPRPVAMSTALGAVVLRTLGQAVDAVETTITATDDAVSTATPQVRWRPGAAVDSAVTIVIPTRDRPAALRACVEQLARTVDPTRTSLLVVDDGSEHDDTRAYLDELSRHHVLACEVVRPGDRHGFNYARLMNAGTARARTPLVLHLNDDVEAIAPGWLDQMAGWLSVSGVGVVGARLVYRDGSIQHAGVIVSPRLGGPDHLFRRLAGADAGYQGLAQRLRNVSAVTGACLLTRTALYQQLGGFDERRFRVQFNDTDYCLRVGALGLRVVYEPAAVLRHDESASRGSTIDLEENRAFVAAYGDYRDPFWSARLDEASLCGPTPLVAPPSP